MTEKSINALFEASLTNPGALEDLTNLLIKRGRVAVQAIATKHNLICTPNVDTEGCILEVVNYIYQHYIPSKKTFEEYAVYVMYKRLTTKIVNACTSYGRIIESLDEVLSDGTPLIELIPNPDIAIPEDVSLKELHLRMSSPKATDHGKDRLKRKVYTLKNLGFSSTEIKHYLGLSENQYRYLVDLLTEDMKDFENKIEMK